MTTTRRNKFLFAVTARHREPKRVPKSPRALKVPKEFAHPWLRFGFGVTESAAADEVLREFRKEFPRYSFIATPVTGGP